MLATRRTAIAVAWLLALSLILLLASCARPRPNNVENICSIFSQYPDWYADARKTEAKWGIPVSVQMAIIYQESSFNARAKPSRKKLLGIIPWKHRSSAYGYSQALKHTWEEYQDNGGGKRSDFGDACDFIGWYSAHAHQKLGISPTDAYALYLAYHDGMNGYAQKTYLKKPWLIHTSHRVSARAAQYQRQLSSCAGRI